MTIKKLSIIAILILLTIYVIVPFASWKFKRAVNYTLDYEGQVEDTATKMIKKLVKEECLKPE